MRRLLAAWLVAVSLCPAAALALDAPRQDTVVVLLFDGFAPALFQGRNTPALGRMRREGAWSHRFIPPFPTISLISGITISTGCWPAHHGIVTNVFRDPQRGVYDHDRDADWLTGCEHLHQVAERQGVRAAVVDWYGAHSATRGDLATYVNQAASFSEMRGDLAKADDVVHFLQMPADKRPRLILAYFKGPDGPAHFRGMDSAETAAAVEESDAVVGKVMDAMSAAPFPTTLFVTTDHGMTEVSTIVNITRILRNHEIDAEALSTGTTSFLYFRDRGQIERAVTELSTYQQFDVIRPEHPPEYAHWGSGPRTGDLIISAHPPYFIEDVARWPSFVRWLGTYGPEFLWARFSLKASHGYPPANPDMAGILYAWGSGIARGREVSDVRAVDFHPTVTHLLGIDPGSPVDGIPAVAFLAPAGE